MANSKVHSGSLVGAIVLFLSIPTVLWAVENETRPVLMLQIDGAIGPGVGDYLTEAIEEARQTPVPPQLILITMNTPGGLVTTLRDINQAILASPIPIACFVYPPGSPLPP